LRIYRGIASITLTAGILVFVPWLAVAAPAASCGSTVEEAITAAEKALVSDPTAQHDALLCIVRALKLIDAQRVTIADKEHTDLFKGPAPASGAAK